MLRSISIRFPMPTRHGHLSRAVRLAALAALSALSIAALTAQAQPAPKAKRLDPLDPKASVPRPAYESSFSQYRPLGDDKPLSWREANDTVTRIGGWRVYAREAQQPDPVPASAPASTPASPPASPPASAASAKPASPPPAANPAPMPAGHGGHKTP